MDYTDEYNFTEKELLDGEEPVLLNENFNNVIVVDCLPVIDMSKYGKLQNIVRKLYGAKGKIVDMYMPVSEKNADMTAGCAFIEYETADEARKAVQDMNNRKLDKKHTMLVNLYNDFEKLAAVPDEFELTAEDYEAQDNTSQWLTDGRSQYLVRHGIETEIWWNDPLLQNENGCILNNGGEIHKEKGKTWTELVCDWSSKGTYLATFHRQGIVTWGGSSFKRLGRFAHSNVRAILFSPNENYLITCNLQPVQKPGDPEPIIVWDIRTGKKLRGFDMGKRQEHMTWPIFKWSHDDRYIARINKDKRGENVISVYNVPEMTLLDKRSIKVPGVVSIDWSPTDNILAYWVPEEGNIPAKVSLISIPNKSVVREKHLYYLSNIKMHWQNNGDYFAVRMVRMKGKKIVSTNLEIFRMREKGIPIEMMELTDEIVAFAWEPNGNRFAIIHTSIGKTHVSFYVCRKKKIRKLGTLEDRQCNALIWSPTGDYIILAGLGTSGSGKIECVDAAKLYTLAEREHFMLRDIEWDPTGRYVISSVYQGLMASEMREKMENGYKVWALDGKGKGLFVCTTSMQYDKLYQVMWRPRPKSLLTDAEQKNIRKSLKDKYYRRFEEEDRKIRVSQMGEAEQKRLELKEQWKQYRADAIREHNEAAKDRAKLRRSDRLSIDEFEYEEYEEVIETEISNEEVILTV